MLQFNLGGMEKLAFQGFPLHRLQLEHMEEKDFLMGGWQYLVITAEKCSNSQNIPSLKKCRSYIPWVEMP